jgi:ferrous iron transport protein B
MASQPPADDPEPEPRAARPGRPFGPDSLLLVGQLKVGKSTLFERLAEGRQHRVRAAPDGLELRWARLAAGRFSTLVDAPGCYSLLDRSEDALAVRDLLVRRRVGGVVWVLDAKSPRRGLALAVELAALRVPVVVALNMVDEAATRGVTVNADALEALLGAPVVPVVASEGAGLGALVKRLGQARPLDLGTWAPVALAGRLEGLADLLAGHPFSAHGLAFLLLAGAGRARDVLEDHAEAGLCDRVEEVLAEAARAPGPSVEDTVAEAGWALAERLCARAVTSRPARPSALGARLAAWTRRPWTGLPLALLALAGMYLVVGWLGAGILVDLLDGRFFQGFLVPELTRLVAPLPWEPVRELLVGPFGLVTVGLALSLGIVLPVLATFFFAFGLLEDSGYAARLSLMLDRPLRKVGLNGKAVLPLIMGFSCVTMAVLATRVLERPKQRLVAVLLLTLAFPCAPLLGVMVVMLARLSVAAGLLLVGLLLVQFVLVGWAANRLLPGAHPDLILELPPLRRPRLRPLLAQTGRRVVWFLREAIPFFMLGAAGLWALDQLGLVRLLQRALEPVLVGVLGLPPTSAEVFLMTLIRREAGAGMLVQQHEAGLYDGNQALVTLLVMTLMVPCINTVLVLYKDRGVRAASAILGFVMVYALGIGALVARGLHALGVNL